MNFISIGGWCGTKIVLKELGLFNEPSLPFDSVRTSIEGIIDCIENDFQNFFPKEIKKDPRFLPHWVGYVGEYVGFLHNSHDLTNKNVIDSFEREFIRFGEKVKQNNCVFLRTISTVKCDDELKHYKKLQDVIDKKYPNTTYIICFLIPNQPKTQYYKNLDNRTFLFTLDDKQCYPPSKNAYKPIFDFIKNENLFVNIPNPNDIEIKEDLSTIIWLVGGNPMVNHVEKEYTI